MKKISIIGVVIVIVIIVGILWYESNSNQQTMTSFQTQTGSSSTGETLALGTSDTVGTYLEASNGMALYTYADDITGTSTCYAECASTWPPYTVASASGLTLDPAASGAIGTITREDGTLQVTYNGMPLYFYSQDVNPGDVNGNGVDGVWSVATP